MDQPGSRSDYLFAGAVTLVSLMAIALRWSGLNSQSLWGDEGYTIWLSRLSPTTICHNLRFDTGPPLYYFIQHYWAVCFGSGPYAVRGLAALFATLSWPLFYLLARKILIDRAAVLMALALGAFSFLQIWYSQEARFYSLLFLFSLASVFCLLLHLENRTPLRFAGTLLCLVAGLYTHNIALFYLPGFAVLWLWYPSETPFSVRIKDLAAASIAALLLYLPWLPSLRTQVRNVHHAFWYGAPTVRDVLDTFCALCGVDAATLQMLWRNALHLQSTALFGILTWGPLVVLLYLLFLSWGPRRSPQLQKVFSLAVYSLLPVVLIFAQSRISTPIFQDRLMIASSAFLPLVFCLPFTRVPGNHRWLYQSLASLLLLGSVLSCFVFPRRYHRDDWRGATEYLQKIPESPRLVVVVPDLLQFLVQYYAPHPPAGMEYGGLLSKYDPPDPTLQSRILELEQHVDTLAPVAWKNWEKYREIDLLLASQSYRTVNPTLEYLKTRCLALETIEFAHLEVRRCQMQPQKAGDRAQAVEGSAE